MTNTATISDREHLLMEAAQCAWEHIENATLTASQLDSSPYWKAQREAHGTVALRHAAREFSPIILEAFQIAEKAGRIIECYDWAFVPWVLDSLSVLKPCARHAMPVMRENWRELAATYGHAIEPENSSPDDCEGLDVATADRLITAALQSADENECAHLVTVTEASGDERHVAILADEMSDNEDLRAIACEAVKIDPETRSGQAVYSSGEMEVYFPDGRRVFIGVGL